MCIINHTTLTTLFLLRLLDIALLFFFTRSFSLYGQKTSVFLQEQSVQLATRKLLASEQALHLWDIVKRRRARGTREETPKRGGGVEKGELAMIALLSSAPRSFAARSRVLARLASLVQIGELACRLASCHLALLSQPGI